MNDVVEGDDAQNMERAFTPHRLSDPMHPQPGMQASPILTSAHKIAIAGLGLIGGSLALRLAERGRFVIGWNHNDKPYAAARQHHIRCVDTLEELAGGKPDVLVLATPLVAMPQVLDGLAPFISPATTLTDVGSVKTMVRQQVQHAGLSEYYVGAHPMAGNEHSGFKAADSSIFNEALWALTVDETTHYERFLTVADMITQGVGNRIVTLDDHIHDCSAALISHMPHVVSTAMSALLVDSPDRNIAAAMAAGSWRDMTRVSLTDPDRTQAMVEEDADNVAHLLRDMARRLTDVADALSPSRDEQSLDDFFASPEAFRQYRRVLSDRASASNALSEQELIIPSHDWGHSLIESARRGEQILRFDTTHTAKVIARSM